MDTIHSWIDTFLELLIVIILIAEYIYDKRLNEHIKSLKKRTKRNFDFEELTKGEGR